jgi:hypothetical protein
MLKPAAFSCSKALTSRPQPHDRNELGAALRHARRGAGQVQRGFLRQQQAARAEMRAAAQDRAEVVRVADAIEPQRQRRTARQFLQPGRQRPLGRRQRAEHDAFVVRAAGQALEVVGLDDGVAQAILHAVREHRLELGNALFEQPDLAHGGGPALRTAPGRR